MSYVIGAIEILKDSFNAQFTNQFMYGNTYYAIEFAKSIPPDVLDTKENDAIKFNEATYIQEREDLFITKDKTKLLIKLAIKEEQVDAARKKNEIIEVSKYYVGNQIKLE